MVKKNFQQSKKLEVLFKTLKYLSKFSVENLERALIAPFRN